MTHIRDTMASIKYPCLSWEVQFTTFCMSANMDCVHSITVVTSCLFSPKGNVTLTQTFPLIICKEQTRCLFEHRSLFAHVSVLNLRFEPHHPRKQRRGNHYGVGWGGGGGIQTPDSIKSLGWGRYGLDDKTARFLFVLFVHLSFEIDFLFSNECYL